MRRACGHNLLEAGQHAISFRAALSAEPGTAICLAWFLIEFASSHFLLNATSLDQFSETADRLLDAFTISYNQLNHTCSFMLIRIFWQDLPLEKVPDKGTPAAKPLILAE